MSSSLLSGESSATASARGFHFLMRIVALLIGSLICAIGCVMVFLPIDGIEAFFWAKLAMGLAIFFAGLIIARLGRDKLGYELHFDPVRGEYFMLRNGQGPEQAVLLANSKNAEVSVHGRHCTIVDKHSNNTMNIALDDPLLAMALAENYRRFSAV